MGWNDVVNPTSQRLYRVANAVQCSVSADSLSVFNRFRNIPISPLSSDVVERRSNRPAVLPPSDMIQLKPIKINVVGLIMKHVIKLIGNSLLVLASLLVSLALFEVALRVFFPDQYFDAFTATNEVDSTKIWAPPVTTTNYFRHPDTGETIELQRNNLGIRLPYDIHAEKLVGGRNIAFFGDSFTANIRLPSEHTFPEVIHALLSETAGNHEVLNFGVDGYGPAQSFLRYRELDPAIRRNLQDVYFVFYINDLSDIVSDGIASLDEHGQLILKPGLPFFPSWLRGLTRLHITYFFVDAYSYLKGLRSAVSDAAEKAGNESSLHAPNVWHIPFASIVFKPVPLDTNATFAPPSENLYHRLGTIAPISTASTTGDQGLDSSIGLLNVLLLQWQKEVEADGGVFHVVVIPRTDHEFMIPRFDRRLNVIDLLPIFSRMLPGYEYEKIEFKNDGHWDEFGNMLAAVALYQDLAERSSVGKLSVDKIDAALERHYRLIGKWQPPGLQSLQFTY